MRRLLLAVSVTVAALSMCTGLNAQERLSTSKYISDGYCRTVEKKLGINSSIEWGYVSRPSFFNEYSLYCIIDDMGAELVYSVAGESIWSAKNRDAVPVDTYRLRIKRADAESLSELIQLAVETSDFLPDRGTISVSKNDDGEYMVVRSVGLDGTIYQFFHDGRAAECWSPREGNCSRLVKIADDLCPAVKSGDRDEVRRIVSELPELKESLKKLLPDWYNEYLLADAQIKAKNKKYSYNTNAQQAEKRHMHVSFSDGQYVFEMNGKSLAGDMETMLDMISDANSNCLLIIDNGNITWADASRLISAVREKEGRATVITDESSNRYWKERGIKNLLTAIPLDRDLDKEFNEKKLKDVAEKLSAEYSSDYEKNGSVVLNPKSLNVLDPESFRVIEVIICQNECIVLFETGFKHRNAITGPELKIKAGGNTYSQTKAEGIADWIDYEARPFERLSIGQCDKECSAVLCVHFPALPKEVQIIDICEDGSERTMVEGLVLSKSKVEDPLSAVNVQGRQYFPGFINHDGIVDTINFDIKSISYNKDKTIVTVCFNLYSPGLLRSFIPSQASLILNGGRKLDVIEARTQSIRDMSFNFQNSYRNYYFQLVFPPLIADEIKKMESTIKEASRSGLPDIRKMEIEKFNNKYMDQGWSLNSIGKLEMPEDNPISFGDNSAKILSVEIFPTQ